MNLCWRGRKKIDILVYSPPKVEKSMDCGRWMSFLCVPAGLLILMLCSSSHSPSEMKNRCGRCWGNVSWCDSLCCGVRATYTTASQHE
mmetsp:Transcript_20215/g.30001  ORF Transcript_20215/g.30001 Transcript_20215/m.30001 type:complete len:88 (-) Transcript_20215:534-797(-)